MSNKEEEQIEKQGSSRRTYIRNSGLIVGGLIVGGEGGSLLGRNTENGEKTKQTSRAPATKPNVALKFFYPGEYPSTAKLL